MFIEAPSTNRCYFLTRATRMPVADQLQPSNTSCRFFNELVRVICSKTARLQTATETFGYTRVYEVIIVDLTQSRRYAFAPFASQTRKFRDATAAQPPCTSYVQERERRMTRV